MKKLFVTGALIAALGTPIAVAGVEPNPEYGGKVDKKANRYFGFDVNGGKVKNMTAVNLEFKSCANPDDNGEQSGDFDARFPIANNGKFGGTETDMFAKRGASGIEYTILGKIDGKDAEGTLKAKLLGTGGCKTGEVDWKAKKPSPEPPAGDPRR